MIFGAQIGLLVYGIIAIIRGEYGLCLGKGRHVLGSKARILGAICLAPIPLSKIAVYANIQAVAAGKVKGVFADTEILILIGTLVILIILARSFYNQQACEWVFSVLGHAIGEEDEEATGTHEQSCVGWVEGRNPTPTRSSERKC